MESQRATWASFSSHPRALQPKRRQQHGAFCRSQRSRHAVSVQSAMPCRPQVFGERGVASCDAGQLLKPPKGPSNQAPATAWRPLPQKACKIRIDRARHAAAPTQLAWERGVASCDVGQLFKPPNGSSDPAPATAWRSRRSKRARHTAVPSTCVWIARSRIVRRGPACQAAQGPFSPSAGSSMAPFAAVSVQDSQ